MDQVPSWLLTQTAAHAHRIVGEELGAMGARGYHFRLLSSLIDDGPASQAALGRRTGIHLSDMVAALNELEDDGFVSRSPDPADKRRNVITITETGRARAVSLGRTVDAVQEKLLAPLTPDERDDFVELLRKLLDHHRQGIPPLSGM